MKKSSITVSFDTEKLGAVQQYMSKKNAELEPELEAFLLKLYDKYVPPMVREYIETREVQEAPAPPKPSRPRPAPRDEVTQNGG